ncbi:MAG: hypothetical protein Q9226_006685 [Calogaya cf. arnoldii]
MSPRTFYILEKFLFPALIPCLGQGYIYYSMHKQFSAINVGLSRIDKQLSGMEKNIDEMSKTMDQIAKYHKAMRDDLRNMRKDLDGLVWVSEAVKEIKEEYEKMGTIDWTR